MGHADFFSLAFSFLVEPFLQAHRSSVQSSVVVVKNEREREGSHRLADCWQQWVGIVFSSRESGWPTHWTVPCPTGHLWVRLGWLNRFGVRPLGHSSKLCARCRCSSSPHNWCCGCCSSSSRKMDDIYLGADARPLGRHSKVVVSLGRLVGFKCRRSNRRWSCNNSRTRRRRFSFQWSRISWATYPTARWPMAITGGLALEIGALSCLRRCVSMLSTYEA